MTIRRRREFTVLSAWILSLLAALTGEAAARPRTLVVLPYAAVDLSTEEQWMGEAVAQSLMLGFAQISAIAQVDRERANRLTWPAIWDDQSALSAARALGADVVVYGEVHRSWPDISIQPRYVEIKGERSDRVALDPVAVPEGALMERLRALPVAYARSLKLRLNDAEVARMQTWAGPTTSQRAFATYVRGQLAGYRGGQEG